MKLNSRLRSTLRSLSETSWTCCAAGVAHIDQSALHGETGTDCAFRLEVNRVDHLDAGHDLARGGRKFVQLSVGGQGQ